MLWILLAILTFTIFKIVTDRNEAKRRELSNNLAEGLQLNDVFYASVDEVFDTESLRNEHREQIDALKNTFNYELSTLLSRTLHPHQIKEKCNLLKSKNDVDADTLLPGIANEASKLSSRLLLDLKKRLSSIERDPDVSTRRRRRR